MGPHKGVGSGHFSLSAGPQVLPIDTEEFGLLANSHYRGMTHAQSGQQKLLPPSYKVPCPSAEGHHSHTGAVAVYSPSD